MAIVIRCRRILGNKRNDVDVATREVIEEQTSMKRKWVGNPL